jgi:polysaccharide pyruvyl transferase WcaK-like protein
MSTISAMDLATEFLMSGCVEVSRFFRKERFEKNQKLKILLVGYNGGRNTGADVRVEVIVRQLYHIFGEDNIHIGVMTLDKAHSSIYFKPPTEIIEFNSIYFRDLLRAASTYHIAVLCEGSLFKSNFANALATFFIGAAGIMKAQRKPCIAYGSEAGEMDAILKLFTRRYCHDTYVISRTEPSWSIAHELGCQGIVGTDTAWTFEPAPKERILSLLHQSGWDGKQPLVGVAAINPFCWPVRPNLLRFLKMRISGRRYHDNYDKWYFFSKSAERDDQFASYLDSIASAVDLFAEEHNAFPVLIGMDRLDQEACQELQQRMKHKGPIFCSTEYDGYDLVGILRELSLLVTSRYHARVLSMPAGVPAIAISRDERLENLFQEIGQANRFYLRTDDPTLREKLPSAMEDLWREREAVKIELLQAVPGYLRRVAGMGKTLKQFVKANLPEAGLKPDPSDWLDYLPPLSPELRQMMEAYG